MLDSLTKGLMEYWLDTRMIAFAEKSIGTSFALDVWEESGLVGFPFRHSASFMFEADTRSYLATKYPQAAEKLADAALAANSESVETKPPYDLRGHAAWRRSDGSFFPFCKF